MTARQSDPDFAHTTRADSNRQAKAHRLALAARSLGLQPYELTVVHGGQGEAFERRRVRRAAGVDRDPSVETWSLAIGQLEGLTRSLPRAQDCPDCGYTVLEVLTMGGRRLLIDPFPHELGTVWPEETSKGPVAQILAGHDERPDDVLLYRQHTASCPESPAARAKRVLRCAMCQLPLDQSLAASDPTYTTHPCCDPREEAQPP